MGGGGQLTEPAELAKGWAGGVYTWQEVQSHCSRSDQWLVIDRKVYNITQWAKRHPGGIRVISHYAGENATVTFYRDCKTHLANFKKKCFCLPPEFLFLPGGVHCFSSRSKVGAKVSEASADWRAGSDRAQPGPEQKREISLRFFKQK